VVELDKPTPTVFASVLGPSHSATVGAGRFLNEFFAEVRSTLSVLVRAAPRPLHWGTGVDEMVNT
jgi:hypothetical protein